MARGERRPELPLPARPVVDTVAGRPRRGNEGAGPDGVPWDGPQLDSPAPDPDVLARLKAWRTEEARRPKVPPSIVFHDRVLAALAAARPRDRAALSQVKRMGPAKLEAYGDALLRLLA